MSLPNPDVYLNHLSSLEARDFEISRCTTIIVLGATIWDILAYVPDDLQILSRSRLEPTIICFFLSRLFAAAYVLTTVIQMTTAVNNPSVGTYVVGALCVLAMGCSSYLFLRRVHAVYADSRGVQWFFSALWFACTMSELAIPLGLVPGFVPGTHYYLNIRDRPIVALGVVSGIFLDTSVFLAISYKIASTSALVDEQISWSTIVSGKALPRLSRAILQGGQQYYLINVVVLLAATVILLLPSVHQLIKDVFVIPLIPLMASMASRVFRNLKLFSPTSRVTFDVV